MAAEVDVEWGDILPSVNEDEQNVDAQHQLALALPPAPHTLALAVIPSRTAKELITRPSRWNI